VETETRAAKPVLRLVHLGGKEREVNQEVYKLSCARCFATVETPARSPMAPERVTCPRCGTEFTVDWGTLFREEEKANA
jgi:hypothetical protein